MTKVSIARCKTYQTQEVELAVRLALDLLGGITHFIKPGAKVLIKPNLLMAKGPEFAVDTHPEVVRAVIRLLKKNECRIIVGDGPSVWGAQVENVDQVYLESGIAQICKDEAVDLVKFDSRRWRGKFPLTTRLDEVEFVVNLPKFKTHDLTLLTGAVKNLFGLVSGTFKTELHKKYFKLDEFANILVDIFALIKPALTIVDGIIALEGDGPGTGGIPKELGLLLASPDCVALDAVMASIMGLEPFDVLTTKEAARRGLGEGRLAQITVVGQSLKDVNIKPFVLPATSWTKKIPSWLVKILTKLIKHYPYVLGRNCIRCAACIDACPNKVISMKPNGIVFDYKRCIACFCCSEVCPAAAIKIKKSLLARIIGL